MKARDIACCEYMPDDPADPIGTGGGNPAYECTAISLVKISWWYLSGSGALVIRCLYAFLHRDRETSSKSNEIWRRTFI